MIAADKHVEKDTATRQVSTARRIIYTEVLMVVTPRTAQILCLIGGGGLQRPKHFAK